MGIMEYEDKNRTHKLCPFCGSNNHRRKVVFIEKHHVYFSAIECSKCGACGPYVKYDNKDDAYKKWNERI